MIFTITIEPDVLSRSWAVYTLHDHAGTLQYVGACRFAQLPATPDARANKFFSHIFPAGRPLTITVLSIEPTRRYAQNAVWKETQKNGRPFMLRFGGGMAARRGLPVMCVETGENFPNSRATCEAHGLTPSALSNHLAGKPGHATVRNKTYKYGSPAVRSDNVETGDPLYAYTVEI